jgi:hypothetical protein
MTDEYVTRHAEFFHARTLKTVKHQQCCAPLPNAATPRDFKTPPPRIYRSVKRREIGNFIAINFKFVNLLFETLFQIENNCVTG